MNLPSSALEVVTEERALRMALRALTESLCSLETVEEVRYLVDGEFADSYGPISIRGQYPT